MLGGDTLSTYESKKRETSILTTKFDCFVATLEQSFLVKFEKSEFQRKSVHFNRILNRKSLFLMEMMILAFRITKVTL